MTGSAWVGSPWLRSQAAHSSTSAVALLGRAVAELAGSAPAAEYPALLLAVPKLATCGVLAEPPHAASARATAAARIASPFSLPFMRDSCTQPEVIARSQL